MHKKAPACWLTLAIAMAGVAQAQPDPTPLPVPGTTERFQEGGVALSELRAYAELGYVSAQYRLAQRYLQGQGVMRDVPQAALWFRRAADSGEPRSQLELAMMHLRGDGVPRNERMAAHWMRQAAESGFQRAQLHVGTMYEYGLGVAKDQTEAYFWYCLASEGVWGNHEAVQARDRLGALLTNVQRASARSAAFYWRPR